MQKLFFEQAWDKTIAPDDREKIIHHFQNSQAIDDTQLSFLWKAVNHKNEQLVTVLIHNYKTTSLQFKETAIAFQQTNQQMKTSLFTLPLEIPAKTSMPWTFIFSDSNETKQEPAYLIKGNTL